MAHTESAHYVVFMKSGIENQPADSMEPPMTVKIARLASINAFCAALVARSEGSATTEQLAVLAATGCTYTQRQARSEVAAMIRQGYGS